MRPLMPALYACLLMAAAAPALAAGETADNDCDAADPGRSIPACTGIIDDHGASEQDRIRAY